jgi:hypothetical protein
VVYRGVCQTRDGLGIGRQRRGRRRRDLFARRVCGVAGPARRYLGIVLYGHLRGHSPKFSDTRRALVLWYAYGFTRTNARDSAGKRIPPPEAETYERYRELKLAATWLGVSVPAARDLPIADIDWALAIPAIEAEIAAERSKQPPA